VCLLMITNLGPADLAEPRDHDAGRLRQLPGRRQDWQFCAGDDCRTDSPRVDLLPPLLWRADPPVPSKKDNAMKLYAIAIIIALSGPAQADETIYVCNGMLTSNGVRIGSESNFDSVNNHRPLFGTIIRRSRDRQ
jgi:hypothetical protein